MYFTVIILLLPTASLKAWLLQVYELNMHRGDYAFIFSTQESTSEDFSILVANQSFWRNYDDDDEKRRHAFSNLFIVRM